MRTSAFYSHFQKCVLEIDKFCLKHTKIILMKSLTEILQIVYNAKEIT